MSAVTRPRVPIVTVTPSTVLAGGRVRIALGGFAAGAGAFLIGNVLASSDLDGSDFGISSNDLAQSRRNCNCSGVISGIESRLPWIRR